LSQSAGATSGLIHDKPRESRDIYKCEKPTFTNPAILIMSASSIPNLNSLRKGARGGARGGVSGRSSQIDRDAVIRSTDGDAASSRISAVDAGYLDDPFAKHLSDENWQRRLPLMNRGKTLYSQSQPIANQGRHICQDYSPRPYR